LPQPGSGAKSDPLFKFALDPIAEQLDANRLVIGIRDALADQTEIDDLIQQWEELPEDFVRALRRSAGNYRDSICATQPALVLKLWPHETKTTDLNGIGLLAQSGTTTSPQSPMTQTENFASEQELLLNVGIKVSPISTPWRHELRRRIVRMPRRFVESEGFGWNYQALPLDRRFCELLLNKAKLDEDSGYNLALEDLRYFDGDVNELKEEPHQVGDHCEVWDISERRTGT
jgi:hypothetical protein